MGGLLSSLIFQPPQRKSYRVKDGQQYHILHTLHGSKIVGKFLDFGYQLTVLFSHGNAEDIGPVSAYFERKVCQTLKVNAFVYEYTGYGCSEGGEPSEECIYNDIRAAYNHLVMDLKLRPQDIILYGRSLGSCATIDLASRTRDPIGGVVLQSPMLSVFRIGFQFRFTLPGDKFANCDKIQQIKSPILIIHGRHDDVVPFWHSMELHKRCLNRDYPTPLWLEAGHNDIESNHAAPLFEKLNQFYEQVRLASRSPTFDPQRRLSPHEAEVRRHGGTQSLRGSFTPTSASSSKNVAFGRAKAGSGTSSPMNGGSLNSISMRKQGDMSHLFGDDDSTDGTLITITGEDRTVMQSPPPSPNFKEGPDKNLLQYKIPD